MTIIGAIAVGSRVVRRRRALEKPIPIDGFCGKDVASGDVADGDELDHYCSPGGSHQRNWAEPVSLQGQDEDEGCERILVEQD